MRADRGLRHLGALGLALVLTAPAAPAQAGGFGRPNSFGAAAVGMGGAFAAIADDPTAVHHNPAGISLYAPTTFLLDMGVVIPDRQYQPADCSVTAPNLPACGAGLSTRRSERELMTPFLLPAFAFSTRFGGAHGVGASRLALGFASFVSQGGASAYSDKLSWADRPGMRKSSITLLEFVPAVAYQASDVLAVGGSLRIGVGFLNLDATSLSGTPITGPMSASATGVTAGGTLGVMVRPMPWLNVAFVYHTAMKVGASGSIDVAQPAPTPELHRSLNVDLPFPQQLSLGVAAKPIRRLRVAAQVDWTNWSSFEHLRLKYAPEEAELYLNFGDNWTVHLGGEYQIGTAMVARLGYSFDSQSIPDVSAERQYSDGPKHTVAAGFGYAITSNIRLDAGLEYLFLAGARTVPASAATVPTALRNVAPGDYKAAVYQAVVTAQYKY